ncbi:MAG: c-type cytochrome [bacterium]
MKNKLLYPVYFVLFVVCVLVLPHETQAQIPTEFENLQVFPKDIGQRELINNMKSFSMGLGVRCNYCHVGEGDDFSTFDFSSDEKQAKKTARIMIQMRTDINNQYLTQLGKENTLSVNCVTCHHGQSRPQTLASVLTEVLQEKGLDAAIEKYRELRKNFYGSSAYDFTEWTLMLFAQGLAGQKKPDAAIAFLKLNVEMFPKFATSYIGLGEVYMKTGDKTSALENFKKALELEPNNRRVKMRIEKLSGK